MNASALERSTRAGFTLVETAVAISILALLAASVLPSVVQARMRANEVTAVETLRTIYLEELQLGLLPARDADRDGKGEYGYLGGGVMNNLSEVHDGVLERGGYSFEVWLPDARGQGVTWDDARSGRKPDPNRAELYWYCYAWPKRPGFTGRSVYFINEDGEVLRRPARVSSTEPAP